MREWKEGRDRKRKSKRKMEEMQILEKKNEGERKIKNELRKK